MENLNRCVDRMLLAVLPGYTPTPKPRPSKKKPDADEPVPLTFAEFTAEVLDWARWWNTEHRPAGLNGRTPVEAWQADPIPLSDVPEAALWGLMLEDDGRVRKLSSHGVRWRGRDYLGAWIDELRRTRTVRARRLREDAKKAEALRRQRFAPATTPTPALRLGALTAAEAARELDASIDSDMAALALPDLIPPSPPPDDWNTPVSLRPSARKEKR